MELSGNSFKTLKESCLAYVWAWAVMAIFVCSVPVSKAAELSVCADNCSYSRIQDAIDNAEQNDIIKVATGRYEENVFIGDYWIIPPDGGPLTINPNPKKLTHVVHLVGANADVYSKGTNDRENESVIVGQVFINTLGNGVTLNGFIIDSTNVLPYINESNRIAKSAIMVASGPSSEIRCNIVKNARRFGIRNGYINGEAPDTKIVNNRIIDAHDAAILNHVGNDNVYIIENEIDQRNDISADGILCLKYGDVVSSHTIIQKNFINGGNIGILNDSGPNSQILQNNIQETKSFAILTRASALISENIVSHCKDGIRTEYPGNGESNRVEITGNTISYIDFSGINVCGAHTFVSENSLSHCNIKAENEDTPDYDYAAIHVEAQGYNSSHSIIIDNTVSDSGNGIQVWADYVTVYGNTFENFGASSSYPFTKVANNRLYVNSPILIGSNFGDPQEDFDPVGLTIDQPDVTVFYSDDLNQPPTIENQSEEHYLIEQNTILNMQFSLSDAKQPTITFTLTTDPDIVAISAVNSTNQIEQVGADQYQVMLDHEQATITLVITTLADMFGPAKISCKADDLLNTYKSTSESLLYTVLVISKPVLTDIPDQTINEGDAFTIINLDSFITDEDNSYTDISWTYSGQSLLTVDISQNREVTITTPDDNWSGNGIITFTATDPSGFTASDAASFTVNAVNDPPVLSTIPGQTIDEDKSFTVITLNDFVTDIDNDVSTIIWNATAQENLQVSIENAIATITINETHWSGNGSITFTATDPGGLSDYTVVSFCVNPVNDPPVVSEMMDQTIDEGQSFTPIQLDEHVDDVEDEDHEILWSCACGENLTVTIFNRIASVTSLDENWNGNEIISCTAMDTEGESVSISATFTVKPVNDPPVVLSISDQTIDEGQSFTPIQLDEHVDDVEDDDNEILWSCACGENLTVTILNRVASVSSLDENWNGSEIITCTAMDTENESASISATFTVQPVNDPPVVLSISDQTIDEGQSFTPIQLDEHVDDVEDEDHEIMWSCACGENLTVTILNRIASVTSLDENWNGNEIITCTAMDTEGESASISATFAVKPVNDPPVVLSISDQAIDEGQSFTPIQLDEHVDDVEDDDNEILWSCACSENLTVTILNRIASVTSLDENWNGNEIISCTAMDTEGESASISATFTVKPVNDPPVVLSISDQTIDEGQSFTPIQLDEHVDDVEDEDYEIMWSCACGENLTVTILNRIASVTSLDENWNGNEIITCTAIDTEGESASISATFTVQPVNDPPVILAISDQTIDEGQSFPPIQLDEHVDDVEDDDNEIMWSCACGENLTVTILNRIASVSSLDENWNGSEIITCTAMDTENESASISATFTVEPVNDPPVVLSISDQTIDEGQSFTPIQLDEHVDDIEDEDHEIMWSCACGENLTVTILNHIASVTSLDENWNGNEIITCTAMDTEGESASISATFTVKPVNDPPVVLSISDQTIDEGQSFTPIQLDDHVDDVEDDDNEIMWSCACGENLTVTILNRVASVTSLDENWNGNEIITCTAMDTEGESASISATFTVTPVNDLPVITSISDQTIDEGQSLTITSDMIQAEDIEDNNALVLIVRHFTNHGTLYVNDAPVNADNPEFELSQITDGLVIYQHDGGQNIEDSFTFIARDTDNGESESKDFVINIQTINDPPILPEPSDITVTEACSITITKAIFQASDEESINDKLNYQLQTAPEHGSIHNNGITLTVQDMFTHQDVIDHKIVYVHNGDENNADEFSFTLSDEEELTIGPFDLNIHIIPVNDPPTIDSNIGITVNEDAFITITSEYLFIKDPDTLNNLIEFTLTRLPDNGTLSLLNIPFTDVEQTFTQDDIDNNKLRYKHDGSETTEDAFRFKIMDDGNNTIDSTRFVITILGVNDPPVAENFLNESTDEDTILTGQLSYTDNENFPCTYHLVSPPSKGSVTINKTSGIFIYTPDENKNGEDSFTYQVKDESETSEPATVNIQIIAKNDPPLIANNGITLSEDETVSITTAHLSASDPDNNLHEVKFQIVNLPVHGALFHESTPFTKRQVFTLADIQSDSIRYQHDDSETQSDTFTFNITDGTYTSTTHTFFFVIMPVNDPPVADNFDNESTNEDSMLEGQLTYDDSENYTCTFHLINPPSKGSVVIDQISGRYTYTPDNNVNEYDSFTYQVKDEELLSNAATVSIHITPVNDPPQIMNKGITLLEGGSVAITADYLAASDVDNQNHEIIFQIEQLPFNGRLFIDEAPFTGDQRFTMDDILSNYIRYKHDDSETKSDSFLFNVTDGISLSESQTFSLVVTPVNEKPTVADIVGNINEDSVFISQFQFNDPENLECTFSVHSQPSNGSIQLKGYTFTYHPDTNFYGIDAFTYQVHDNGGLVSEPGTVTINVVSVNDPPEINDVPSNISLNEGTDLKITSNILSATDPDNMIYYQLAQLPLHGKISKNGNNLTLDETFFQSDIDNAMIIYSHDGFENTSDSFYVVVQDADGLKDSTMISLTIIGVNDPPVANNIGNIQLDEDYVMEGQLSYSDPENNTCTYHQATAPSNGTVIIDERTGVFSYTPRQNYNGSDSFTYFVKDSENSQSQAATVSFVIKSVNDLPMIQDMDDIYLEMNESSDKISYSVTDIETPDEFLIIQILPTDPNLIEITNNDTNSHTFVITPKKDKTGTARVMISITDENYDTSKTSFSVFVTYKDTIAPVITLKGDPLINLEKETEFIDPGAIAKDNGLEFDAIADYSNFNKNQPGIYHIKYTFTDLAGNVAIPVYRTVNVYEIKTMTVTGKVHADGIPLTNVTVTDRNASFTVVTDEEGVFTYTGLKQTGEMYYLIFSREGYEPVTKKFSGYSPYDNQSLQNIQMLLSENQDIFKFIGLCTSFRTKQPLNDVQIDLFASGTSEPLTATTHSNEMGQYTIAIDINSIQLPSIITLKTIKQGYQTHIVEISTDDFINEFSSITHNFEIPKLTRLMIDMPVSRAEHFLAKEIDAVTITVRAFPDFSHAANEFCIAEPDILSRYNANEKAYIIRYSPYQSFSMTFLADTTEDLRIHTGYQRTRQIYFTEIPEAISYTATASKGLTVTKGKPVVIKSIDTRSKTLLEIPVENGFDPEQLPETIDFTIQEYDDYSLVEGKIVAVDIQDDQGNKLGDIENNPLKKIYIEMGYPASVTKDDLLDGRFLILHADSAAEIFEGKNVPNVPTSQIDNDKTTDDKVRFWVHNLSAFAIQEAIVPETPPSRELPHPPSNCFIQSANHTAYSIGWLLNLLSIGAITGVLMMKLSKRSKQILPTIIGLFFCISIVLPHLAVAQMQTNKVMFSLMPGGMVFEKNKNIGDGPVFALGLGYSFTPRLEAELMAMYGQHNVSYWDENKQVADYEKSGSLTYNMNIHYHLTASKIFIPYFGLGIGSMNFESDAIDDNNAVRMNYGLGAKYFLDESIALRGDVYHIFSLDDPDNQFVCTVGLTLQLGAKPIPKVKPVTGPDKDGDGITDSKDECPDTPANLVVNRVGCPKDSDMDGVYDNMDECPNTPDHVIVDRAGCPKDSDLDGVYDHLDQCPDTPKQFDVNPMGCPPDKDKDAVPDYKDACPDTPPNTPVDHNGCPNDHDSDGVLDSNDNCPNTPKNTRVDKIGCPIILDHDNDGIPDSKDQCPDTKPGVPVDHNGCQRVVKKQICLPFAVQVSSYPERQKAHQVAMKYRKKGDPLFVSMRKSGNQSIFGIFYGVYHTQGEAENAVIKLKQRKFKKVILMNLPYAIHVEPNEMFIDDAIVKNQLIKRGYSPYEVRADDAVKCYVGAYVNAQDATSIVNILITDGFKATIEKRCIEKTDAIQPVQSGVSIPEKDQDHDGVPDSKDRCPDTIMGSKIDAHGCQIMESELIQLPYAVQVSSYPTRKQAHDVARKYRKKGEPLFASMIQSTDKKVYSIFYGVYESTSEADSVAHNLKRRHFKDVMRLKLPFAILVQPNTVYVDIDTVRNRLNEKGFIAYQLIGSNETKYYVGAYPNAELAQKEAEILMNEGFDARVEKRAISRQPEKPKDLPYVLLISAYADQAKSFEVAKYYRKKGDPTFNSYTDVPGTDKDYEIYYGYYQTFQETSSVIETLKKRRFRQFDLKNKPYAICVGIVDQLHDLKKLEARLSQKGYLSYAIPVYDRPDLLKIYVGAFKSNADAKACFQKMKADGFMPTIVLRSDKRSDTGKLEPQPTLIDSDHDGISDDLDKCPDTPLNTLITPDGCPKLLPKKVSVPTQDRNEYPYTIQINAYPNKAKAIDIIRKFRKKGDPMYMSYIKMSASEDSYGIFYGYYQTFEDVKKVAAQLKARLFRRVDILKMPYTIQLGIFEKTDKIDTLETSLYKKGYASYRLFHRAGEGNIQILIGAYKTENGAQQLKELLTSEGFDAKIVKRIGAPAAQPEIPLLTVLQDKDKDGILDEVDQCPDTVTGDMVNQDGCSIAQISEQDFDTKPLFVPLVSSIKSSETEVFYPYTIRVSSYKEREAANQIVIKFRQKGDSMFTSYGQTKDGTPVHDVFFGFYRNFEESQMAALALERRHFKNIEMIKMPYAIQMGVFDSYTDLVKKENELMSNGYLTYSVPDRKDDSNIRLLIGAYPTEKAAEKFVEELKANGFSSVIVKR